MSSWTYKKIHHWHDRISKFYILTMLRANETTKSAFCSNDDDDMGGRDEQMENLPVVRIFYNSI